MDWIVGALSLLWDDVFKPDLFPAYLILAISVSRRSEWVLLMTFAHAIFLGSVDASHLLMFSGYAFLNYLREYTSIFVVVPSLALILVLTYKLSISTLILVVLVSIYAIHRRRYVEE